ncbi:MAG TPA: hypothetical protein P5323_00605 [Candidatus Moranbacteria bacterium]|nr:hypothetical protein [Candidatus Moranbacteria bacterium]HRY27614.1 hypothetical protein [Candidatus Moranbacteria bacterium]HSA07843.1 hypothetical protein [Candidatus Moranbacteria bacterium]
MNKIKNKKIFFAVALTGLIIILLSGSVFAATSATFVNPLGSVTEVQSVLSTALAGIQKIVIALALIVIVVGAIMYIVSTGESATIERAKKTITMACVGLVIALAAPSILKELATIVGWSTTDSTVSNATAFSTIALNALKLLLSIVATLSVIMMVVSGMMYMTSAGDNERIEKGKSTFKYALIGTIIALSALIIVTQIATLLGVSTS